MSFEEQVAPALEPAAKHAAEVDREGRFPEEAIGALRDAGMLGLTLPTTVGGLGGTPADSSPRRGRWHRGARRQR